MIRLEQVTVLLGRTRALDRLDLEIQPGITGVFGPNGAGKSTLLRVVAGLLKPTGGRVLVDGRPLSLGDESLRRRIGFVGHDSGLYPRLSLLENLRLYATLYGVPERRSFKLLEALQLDELAARPVFALSSGSKRRAALARGLLHDPDVLLLDEPYANVDEDAAERVSEAIVSWSSPGRVALVATHGGKRVKRYADAGLVLKQGRAVVYGRYRQEPRTGIRS